MFIALFSILKFNFLSLLFSIILTYLMITNINSLLFKSKLSKKIKNPNTNISIIATTIISLIVSSVLIGLGFMLFKYVNIYNISLMMLKFINILENLRENPNIPAFILNYIPENFIYLKTQIITILKNNIVNIGVISKSGITHLVYIVLGFVIGAMLVFYTQTHKSNQTEFKPLGKELIDRINTFKTSFEHIFIAQIKISFINAVFTGIYLLIILPLFNIDIPFKYLLVLITFLTGLLPVIGNLISNTLIIVFSLTISFKAALCSLAFLVIIHKFEYFLNAKIIGGKINSSSWELLLSMLIFEHIFGLGGMIVAPIYYAYIKSELQMKNLI